jgi:hypothetical protein
MWILMARAPAPDAAYWPGRRVLAALDAVLWPLAAFLCFASVPGVKGVILPVVSVIVAVGALVRLRTAVWSNPRYRFTTWRALRIVIVLLLLGLALKLGSGWL